MLSNYLLLTLCCVLTWTDSVRAENEFEVKRGVYPFMAILYYPDDTVVDATGSRFQHAAVLIRPEWLLSAAIDHSVLDNIHLGFPRKTLLARMGALTLDPNFVFNEDEDEQQREVIQIVKPSVHDKSTWWTTDITLLKTLLPFTLSSAIAPTTITPNRTYTDHKCTILVYSKKYGSASEIKFLMQLNVELLPASTENCGAYFSNSTMTCAIHDPNPTYHPEFCPGNSGGPLLCEGEVVALQTYIENDCKQPHLYQLLAPWDTFINCAIEQKCNVEDACNVCTVTNKDELSIENSSNDTQTNTVKEGTDETYSGSNKYQNNSVFENETSSERIEHPVLKENESTESIETKALPSYESQALTSEENLSSTSENQNSSSMLSESNTTEQNQYSSSPLSEIDIAQENQYSSSPLSETDIAQENQNSSSMPSEIDIAQEAQTPSLMPLESSPEQNQYSSSMSSESDTIEQNEYSSSISPENYTTKQDQISSSLTERSVVERRMYSNKTSNTNLKKMKRRKKIGHKRPIKPRLSFKSSPPFVQTRYQLNYGSADNKGIIITLILPLIILVYDFFESLVD